MKKYLIILFLSLINLCVNSQQVEICHIPYGNPSNKHEIFVDSNAIDAHLNHGDYLGPCDSVLIIIDTPQFEIFVIPNPYTNYTNIEYILPEDGYMLIEIYDQQANKIETIVNSIQIAGTYFYQFGTSFPGIYLLAYNFWGSGNYYGTIVIIEL